MPVVRKYSFELYRSKILTRMIEAAGETAFETLGRGPRIILKFSEPLLEGREPGAAVGFDFQSEIFRIRRLKTQGELGIINLVGYIPRELREREVGVFGGPQPELKGFLRDKYSKIVSDRIFSEIIGGFDSRVGLSDIREVLPLLMFSVVGEHVLAKALAEQVVSNKTLEIIFRIQRSVGEDLKRIHLLLENDLFELSPKVEVWKQGFQSSVRAHFELLLQLFVADYSRLRDRVWDCDLLKFDSFFGSKRIRVSDAEHEGSLFEGYLIKLWRFISILVLDAAIYNQAFGDLPRLLEEHCLFLDLDDLSKYVAALISEGIDVPECVIAAALVRCNGGVAKFGGSKNVELICT